MPKLTQRSVAALAAKESDYFVWDTLLPGFGVRVMPSGSKTYQVQYRRGARTRRASLGRHGTVSTEQARNEAREMLGQVAGGSDPIEEIALERMAQTMGDLCDRFLEIHVNVHLKRLCCTNLVRDSSRESSVVAGMHERTHTPDLQDQELASLQ